MLFRSDNLYYHFANLGLVLIGFVSIQSILNPFVVAILIPGTIVGFIVSWQVKDSKMQYMDTFIGMLSLGAVIIILGRLYDTALTFDNLLRIFSTALVWLALFQSFGIKAGKGYAMLQFISVCLLISSVGLALEQETFYLIGLALFLFIFIFTMRLGLVCEKKKKGSTIIGDKEEIMSLWQQIKIGALMFIFVFVVAAIIYPFVPRFENLSLRWIPSTLLGLPEKVPLLKLLKEAPLTLKDNKKMKKEQLVDDGSKKRETAGGGIDERKLKKRAKEQKEEKKKKQTVKRFPARKFNKDIDMFKIESLTIKTDRNEVPRDKRCQLHAELKMSDGSVIPATRLVDWKVTGTADVTVNSDGTLVPKKEGSVTVSASYMGSFSDDIKIKIAPPLKPVKKRSWLYYLLISLLWLFILALSFLSLWIFMKGRRLAEMAVKDPRGFIKEVYLTLSRAFRPYGIRRFDYLAHREFLQSLRQVIVSNPEPMHLMTEGVLEARFSKHDISVRHSWKILGLFHEVKDVVLEREEGGESWKKILFRLFLLDILMVPRR